MKELRLFARRIKKRMGRWFWVFVVLLIPVIVHEIDHVGLAVVDAAAFPNDEIPTLDDLIGNLWGTQAIVRWHNAIVFLGGAVIVILLFVVGKKDLAKDHSDLA